jgi:sugar phosphate isomerase/epimerase
VILFGGPIVESDHKAAGRSQSHGSATADIDGLVRLHVEKGYRAAYAPQVKLQETDRIAEIRRAFEAADVQLAEVQCWNNLLDPDPEARRLNRQAVVEALAVADELGALFAINTVGSYAPQSLNHHHPDNFSNDAFDAAVELARYFIDTVRPKTAKFTFEVLAMHVVDGPEVIENLVRAVDRNSFGVHLDLVNLVSSPRRYWQNAELARECVHRFGQHIIGAHAKDVIMEDNCDTVRIAETRPGTGALDYGTYVKCLADLPQPISFMMEHLTSEQEYDTAAEYIRRSAHDVGVEL